jgi:hypothetical protein
VKNNDFLSLTIGYLIMRAGLIAHWLRFAFEVPAAESTAHDIR